MGMEDEGKVSKKEMKVKVKVKLKIPMALGKKSSIGKRAR